MYLKSCIGVAISACLMAHPAMAADPRNAVFANEARSTTSPYVGASISFRGDVQKGLAPRLGLDAGVSQRVPVGSMAIGTATRAPLIELQPKTELKVRGRSLSAADKGGSPGVGKILLAIAAAAGAALLVSQLADSDDERDDERCMIEPELCD